MSLRLTTSLVLDELDYISEPYARDIYLNDYHVSRALLNAGDYYNEQGRHNSCLQ